MTVSPHEIQPSSRPRILIIDDVFGRRIEDETNQDREQLCGAYHLRDVTGDLMDNSGIRVLQPIADAVFFRGQSPIQSQPGDVVENDLNATLDVVRSGWPISNPNGPQRWSMVLVDLCFYTGNVTAESHRKMKGMPVGRTDDDDPGKFFGLKILECLQAEFPDLPVAVLSSKQREYVSKTFSRLGAVGFISRTDPEGPKTLKEILWRHGLVPDSSGTLLGNSLPLLLAIRAARRLSSATAQRNVLIRGERGVGKELLARFINQCANPIQLSRPFAVVDSGALSGALYGSELFGHIKGAYTGADQDRMGRIEEADGGDLFLDEIGNMPADVQAGLLRVLETRVVMPVGSSKGRKIDVRFISATNENIEQMANRDAGFRADLLDRLCHGGTINLPPLKDRSEDIPLLTRFFVNEASSLSDRSMQREITSEAMDLLMSYSWPGNVRELRSCVFEAVNNYPDIEYLVPQHLSIFSFSRSRISPEKQKLNRSVPSPKSADHNSGRSEELGDLVGFFERIEDDFHEELAFRLEACLKAYTDPLTGCINYSGAYRMAVKRANESSNLSADAKRWFKKLFAGKNGILNPISGEIVEKYPLLIKAKRWSCGSDSLS